MSKKSVPVRSLDSRISQGKGTVNKLYLAQLMYLKTKPSSSYGFG